MTGEDLHPFPYSPQSKPPTGEARDIESDAIVRNRQSPFPPTLLNQNGHGRGLRMADDIRQQFLNAPIERRLQRGLTRATAWCLLEHQGTAQTSPGVHVCDQSLQACLQS